MTLLPQRAVTRALALPALAILVAGCSLFDGGREAFRGPYAFTADVVPPESSMLVLPNELVEERLAVRRDQSVNGWVTETVVLANDTATPRENVLAIRARHGGIGLRIILDNRRITAGNGAQESGLWYADAGSEQDWIDDWGMLAQRYAGDPTVMVSVPLKPGADGRFRLLLGDPVNATLADGEAIGAITDGGGGGGGGDPIGDPTVPDDGIVLDFTVRDGWDTGFVADMTVTNAGDEAVDGWRFLLAMPNDIVNIWSAEIAEDRGDAYVIENADWNGGLAPGATATLGFQGTGDIDPSAVDCTVVA